MPRSLLFVHEYFDSNTLNRNLSETEYKAKSNKYR